MALTLKNHPVYDQTNTVVIYLTKMTHSYSQQGRMNKIDFTTCLCNINKRMCDKKMYVHIQFTLYY